MLRQIGRATSFGRLKARMRRLAPPLSDFIQSAAASPLARWIELEPWEITGRSESIVRQLLADLDSSVYRVVEDVAPADVRAIHRARDAQVEPALPQSRIRDLVVLAICTPRFLPEAYEDVEDKSL